VVIRPHQSEPIRHRGGAATVELAMVLLPTTLIFFGLFEFGRLLMAQQLATQAAFQGARLAVVSTPQGDTQAITNYVKSKLSPMLVVTNIRIYQTDGTLDTSGKPKDVGLWPASAFGEPLVVNLEADVGLILGGFLGLPQKIHLSVYSVMYSEGG
jgi:hypothetical protein